MFETLQSFQDIHGNYPKITANTVVANPDFDNIRVSYFSQYHYEPFTETLKRYHNHNNTFALWKEGIEKGLFIPKFHFRERVNIKTMVAEIIIHPVSVFLILFYNWMNGFKEKHVVKDGIYIQETFYTNRHEAIKSHKEILNMGLTYLSPFWAISFFHSIVCLPLL